MIAGFAADCERRGLAARTVSAYRERLALLPRDPREMTRDELQAWIDERGGPASRAAHRSTAIQLWAWMVEEGHATENIAKRCRAPKVRQGRPRPIAHDDLVRAMRAADPRMRVALLLGALAGLRCAEMAALRWSEIDFDAGLIHVVDGKGGKDRVVPLAEQLEEALVALGLHRRGFVLLTGRGKPYPPREVGVLIAKHLRRCGVEATAHALRHTFATSVWQRSRDMRATAKLLGHASTRTTEVYARWTLDDDIVACVRSMVA